MATEILMPQMGESIAEGTVTKWLVAVGDTVERDQPLLEISTDKVDAEIPSPASGTLLATHRAEGETVPVNEVVGLIGEPGEAVSDAPTADEASTVTDAEASEDSVTADDAVANNDDEEEDGAMTLEKRLRRFSSPLVRNIAAKEDVDLRDVTGTGLHGRVTKKDILAFIEQRAASPTVAPTAAAASPAATVPAAPAPAASTAPPAARPAGSFHVPAYGPSENVVIEPMSRIRKLTAAHMTYSKATSAHVSTVFHIDMTRVDRLRRRAKDAFLRDTGTKLTYMPFIFKAVAAGLRRFPQLNAAIDGENIVYKKDINLGMAVAMDKGLIVPVIRNADELSLVGLARAANGLADRARTKKLSPDEVQAGTFTITNPGVFGSQFGTPIINQPQVAILGIGTIEKRPVVQTDADGADVLAIRTMSYFAITFDHRLVDGADADHFMIAVRDMLQDDAWSELAPYV